MHSHSRVQAALTLSLVFAAAAQPVNAKETLVFSFKTFDTSHCVLTVDLGNLVTDPVTVYTIDVDGLNGSVADDITFNGTATEFSWYPSPDDIRSAKTTTILKAEFTDPASDTYSKTYYPKIRTTLYADQGAGRTVVATKTVSNRCEYLGP